MLRHSFQPKTLLKNTLAALLVITLSGAYCLFCCGEIIAAGKAAHHPASAVSQTEHCHFSKTAASETSRTAESVNAFECCGLRFSFFVAKLEKNQLPHAATARANGFFSFPKSVKIAPATEFTDHSYRAPVFESRDLHIRNCVFRI